MRAPIFELTRREQRAVIVIMIALLALAAAKRYYDLRLHAAPTNVPVSATTTPVPPSDADEER